jgi:hypothetical protein
MIPKRSFLLCFALLALVPALLLAQTKAAPENAGAEAWITHVEGRVFFQNFEKAAADMAVNPGDEINTQTGRIEIELGEGNWIRLDRHTRVVFTDIQKDTATLSLWEGSVYLHLKNQAVKVRSPKGESLVQEKGLVRIDSDQNETKIVKNSQAADDFAEWNQRREEEQAASVSIAGRYTSPWAFGGAFSPFGFWSPMDWYGCLYPYWSAWGPYMWPYYWPSWYFGWSPFFYGDYGLFGMGYYPRGFFARGYGRGGRPRDGDIRRGGFGGERRISGIYPSRIQARTIRPSSSSSRYGTSARTTRSGSSASSGAIAGRSTSRSGGGSSSGGSRSGGSRSGGSSRGGSGGGGGHRR